MSASVRIVLYDPEHEETVWVSHYRVNQDDLLGVLRATGDAATSFVANLARDEHRNGAVTRWLRGEKVIGQ